MEENSTAHNEHHHEPEQHVHDHHHKHEPHEHGHHHEHDSHEHDHHHEHEPHEHGHHHEHDSHEHDHHHEHEPHEHGHHHEHDSHEHGHHHHEHENVNAAPDKRLFALLNYMYSHNTDHTRELEELSLKVKEIGNDTAYEKTMEAVGFFKNGNDSLKKALEALSGIE